MRTRCLSFRRGGSFEWRPRGGIYTEVIPETFPKVEEGGEVQPKTEDVGEEPPSTMVIMKANALESSSRRSRVLHASAALRSTFSFCHYSQLKSPRGTQMVSGVLIP